MHTTLLLAVLALGAPAPKDPPKDFTIVGEWLTERLERAGKDVTGSKPTIWAFFPDGTFHIREDGKHVFLKP